ncbi:MAG TPA: RES family NAD+ phosphorylase [Metabacillus sp.]|nr:RES family NAD+ phosphorylase [Metabacillus sp.]
MADWKDGLTKEELFDIMIDMFYRDLEKWFNAYTFYCDSCIDEFIENWPGIYNRDLELQTNAISLDSFYSGGYIRDSFTKEEFTNLLKDFSCPNCDSPLTYNIWPYDLRFRVPNKFELNVREIADIAKKTPFLLMLHPFAQELYNEIQAISKKTNTSLLPNPLYRARVYDEKHEYVKEDFFAADNSIIKEGRYNHAGKQVLYLAEDDLTCYQETREPESGIMLATLEIKEPLKVLDLMDEKLEDNDIIQAIQYSSLMSSPAEGEGWYKPHYVFTRFVSDAALSVGFDAIRYPSVRSNTGKNIVVLNYENFREKIGVLDYKYFSKEDFLLMQKRLRGY